MKYFAHFFMPFHNFLYFHLLNPLQSTPSNMDRQILCHLFRQIICFVLLVYRYIFLNNLQYWHFLYSFSFNLKKKSYWKSKYFQSTVEYLTEYLTINIWRGRKTLLKRYLFEVGGGIKDVRHTETIFKEYEKERKGVKFVKMNRRKNRKTTQRVWLGNPIQKW